MKKSVRSRSRKNAQDRATYSPDALARLLGISRTTVYDQLRRGTIPHVRMGRRFIIPKAAVETWFASMGQGTLQQKAAGARGRH